MRGPYRDERLVHLPGHPGPLPGAALAVGAHLQDEVKVLLGVLLLQERAEQRRAVCEKRFSGVY